MEYKGITLKEPVPELFSGMYDMCYIAGGYAREKITGKLPGSDIDLFLYEQKHAPVVEGFLQSEGWEQTERSRWASTWQRVNQDLNVQVISGATGEPEEVLNTFDFTLCQFAITEEQKGLYTRKGWRDTSAHMLRLTENTQLPIITMARALKYARKHQCHMGLDTIHTLLDRWVEHPQRLGLKDRSMKEFYDLVWNTVELKDD